MPVNPPLRPRQVAIAGAAVYLFSAGQEGRRPSTAELTRWVRSTYAALTDAGVREAVAEAQIAYRAARHLQRREERDYIAQTYLLARPQQLLTIDSIVPVESVRYSTRGELVERDYITVRITVRADTAGADIRRRLRELAEQYAERHPGGRVTGAPLIRGVIPVVGGGP